MSIKRGIEKREANTPSSPSDVAIWAKFGRGFRTAVRGNVGFPPDILKHGQFYPSAIGKHYVAVLIIFCLLLLLAIAIIPISLALSRNFFQSLKSNRGRSKIIYYFLIITVGTCVFCVCCGFLGGLRANGAFTDGIGDVLEGFDAITIDVTGFSTDFPRQVGVMANTIRNAAETSIRSFTPYFNSSKLVDVQDPATRIIQTLQGVNAAYLKLERNAPQIDRIVTGFFTKITSLATLLEHIQSELNVINAEQTLGDGGSFQLVSAIGDSTDDEQTALFNLNGIMVPCTNTRSFTNQLTASGVSLQSAYFSASADVIIRWTDINATIYDNVLNSTELDVAQALSSLNSYLNKTLISAQETGNLTNSSVTGVHSMINSIIGDKGMRGYDKARNSMFPLILVLVEVLIIVLLVFTFLRWPKLAKYVFLASPFFVMLLLVLGAILFILAVIFGDICQLFEENNASFLMGLSTSIANSTTNFLQARQADCIDKDLGFIKLATDIGLVTVTSGNFTALVAPSINRIRLKLLDNFTLDKFIPANSSIIQNDTISGPASNLRANLCSLSISAIPSTNADSMSITVASLLDDINKNKESPSIPSTSEYKLISGSTLTYANLATFGELLKQLQNDIREWQASLISINADISELTNLYGEFSRSSVTLATPLPSTMSADYEIISQTLTEYVNSTSSIVSQQLASFKWHLMSNAEAARLTFESSLPCKQFAENTVVFQGAMCDAFLNPLDSLYTSFLFAGLGFSVLICCFPFVLSRITASKEAKKVDILIETDDEESLPTFGMYISDDDDGLPTPSPPSPKAGYELYLAGAQRGAPAQPEYHMTLPNAAE